MLHSRSHPSADVLVVAPEIALARARVHEATGPARVLFALAVAARLSGPVLWIQPVWTPERLMGDGVSAWIDPGRLIVARPRTLVDILWTAEEALRAGVVPLVVADLPGLPTLTATRRLHLAAETGEKGAGTGAAPLCLLLAPDPGGVPGVETRWRLAPAPGWATDDRPRWLLTRLRARLAPERTWPTAARDNRLVPTDPRSPTAGHNAGRTAHDTIAPPT
jgi:protein ImuA